MGAWAPWLLVVASLLAWSDSFSVPFLFDDLQAIVENPQVRTIWPPWHFVTDPVRMDITTSGRPFGALTFALSYAVSGFQVAGWHAFNLAVHVLAALTLYGIVRRTLRLPGLRSRFGASADPIAFGISLLWVLHPLQTKAVTYVVQRVEVLAGLLGLVTLYAVLRGVTEGPGRRWLPMAVGSCALAMATKETAFAIPLAVLLFDRAFLAGSLRAVLRERWKLHAALASTWLVLGALVALSPRIRVAAEAGMHVPPLDYAKTQCWAILRYLGLVLWPGPLVFDYGMSGDGVPLLESARQYFPWAIPLLLLLALAAVGTWRNRGWGFLAAVFFLTLFPSSSFVPIAQEVAAEHRMYLPLAALVALAVVGAYRALGAQHRWLLPLALILAGSLGVRTFVRNRDYASDLSIWSDTVTKRPGSSRAQTNLGLALYLRGDLPGAEAHQREAVRLRPGYSEAHHGLAATLLGIGRAGEAEAEFREALDLSPASYESRLGLGETLLQRGAFAEAAEQFEKALQIRADLPGAHLRLGAIRHEEGRLDDAVAHYEAALRYEPTNVQLLNQLGIALAEQGRIEAAAERFRRALSIQPGFEDARANLQRLQTLGH